MGWWLWVPGGGPFGGTAPRGGEAGGVPAVTESGRVASRGPRALASFVGCSRVRRGGCRNALPRSPPWFREGAGRAAGGSPSKEGQRDGDRVGYPRRSHRASPGAPLQPAPGPNEEATGAIRHETRPRCPGDKMEGGDFLRAPSGRAGGQGDAPHAGGRPCGARRSVEGGCAARPRHAAVSASSSFLPQPCLGCRAPCDGTRLGPAGATARHGLVAPGPSTVTHSQAGGILPSPPRSPVAAPAAPWDPRLPSLPVPSCPPLTTSPPSPAQRCWGAGCATRTSRRRASARRRGRAPRRPYTTPQVGERRRHPRGDRPLPLRPSPNPPRVMGTVPGAVPGTVPGAVPVLSASPRAEEMYSSMAERCWEFFVHLMRNVTAPQLCEWKVISRPYSWLQSCLEDCADELKYGYPNALAEQFIFQSHYRYFQNCSAGNQVFDPPEDVLLAMIIAPICLIPFLVTVVIWRSKDGKAQP
uniref:Receptor activity modifying protein 2 n=1 Tax=Anser cygnoides TaxID=8845 RepID=A0A8B9E664_ANSCY